MAKLTKRSLRLKATAFLTAALAISATAENNGRPEINRTIEYFPVENVRLTSGPFKTAQDKDIEYLLSLDADRLLAPYYKEAGLPPKAENYGNWENTGLDGHIGGHYLSALAYMYAATGNAEIQKRLDYFLRGLKECQDASGNGYLCGVPGGKEMWNAVAQGDIRAGGFDLNGKWVPLYNIHKIYAGLRDAYQQTHNDMAGDMLIALTEWMAKEVSQLDDSLIQKMLISEHGGLNEIFADVALITGNRKYMRLARQFSHNDIIAPLVLQQDELTGKHANTQIPKVIGFKRIADIEKDSVWNAGVEYFWDNVVNKRTVSIGGNSVREHFHAYDDFSSMLESEQGPETCNTYNMLRLSKMMHESQMQPKYVDFEERALFNHILSSQNPEHGGFVYFTPMRSGHYRVYSQPQTSFWCCVGSGLENHARYGEYIYAHSGKDVYVNLFIPSRLSWEGNMLTQATQFPDEESTLIEVTPSGNKSFALNIRVPGWCDADSMKVEINGRKTATTVRNGYIVIDRKWKKGDKVNVALPMQLRTEQLPDKSENYSILYGPIVLAANLGTADQTGLFADDSRMGHVADGARLPLNEMPVAVGDAETLLSGIHRLDDKTLRFSIENIYPDKYNGLILEPFSRLHECRYMVYFPVVSENELKDKTELLAKRQAEEETLRSKTSDMVACGEQQPESDHFIEMHNTFTGSEGETHWRYADKGGWFAYRMKSGDKQPDTLRIRFKGESGRSATVYVDGEKAGTLTDGENGNTVETDLPLKVKSTSEIIVKIEATPDSATPRIYEVRLLRNAE